MSYQARIDGLPASSRRPEWSFYLGWVALTTLCVPIAFILAMFVLRLITPMIGDFMYVNGVRHITEDYLMTYVFVPIVSVLTGALQYVLLRPYLKRMGWWVPATVAGWHLGVVLIGMPGWLGWVEGPVRDLALIFLIMGLSIGVMQWLVLRQRLARAGWWIAASALGWVILGLINPDNTLDQYEFLALCLAPACTTAALLALSLRGASSTDV